MDMTLIIGNYNGSSWSMRPWIFAMQTGIPVNTRCVKFHSTEWQQTIASLSPTRKVPVLHAADEVVWDSLAILECMAERHAPESGWPTDPKRRVLARSLSCEMHSGFALLRQHLPFVCYPQQQTPDRDNSSLWAEIQRVDSLWNECLARFGGPWLMREFSIVDAMFAPLVVRFSTYGVPLSERAQQYVAHWQQQPAMQRWYQLAYTEWQAEQNT